ncbi:MAG: decaprenyl-phosphate phosphoribosyltransferase [Candidatus Latescibacterota bacterium]|nr:decaprenyl-phosphate phosphoribosyltransferase [Candidatus Latescibacterota bacterium]
MFYNILLSARPKQWVKNLFVLAALFFSRHLFHQVYLLQALGGMATFVLLSAGVYLVNDLFDLEADRRHPEKSKRPLASGALSPASAGVAAFVLFAGGLALAFRLSADFGWIAASYAAVNFAYSFRLKQVVLVDVLVVASGFLLRALGGAVVIDVFISTWFVLCSFTLTLLLTTVKRRQELVRLQSAAAEHRAALAEYQLPFLDQVISILTSATIVCYALYAMGVGEEESRNMQWTIPLVFYGVLRYLYVVHRHGDGDDPTALLFRDRALQVTVLAWAALSLGLLYFRE